MQLIINGPLNKYYLQTLCMLFYPGAKFRQDDDLDDDTSISAPPLENDLVMGPPRYAWSNQMILSKKGLEQLKQRLGKTEIRAEFETGSYILPEEEFPPEVADIDGDIPVDEGHPIPRVPLLSAEFTRVDRDGGVEVECIFHAGGRYASHKHFELPEGSSELLGSPVEDDPLGQAARMAAGLAAIGAGKKLFGMEPAWGLLTGIRPAKIAAGLLTEKKPDGSKLRTPADCRKLLTKEFKLNPRKSSLAVEIARNEQKIARLAGRTKNRTCSIYISIPFCPSRCSYCSFVSYTSYRLLSLIPDYVERICDELEELLCYIRLRGMRVLSIYVGGGTPTILDARSLEKILEKATSIIDTSSLAEFTLEAGRPDTIDKEKLTIARLSGVNRVSINPQTMDDDILRSIGRRHTVRDFMRAYNMAVKSGIPCINTDLIAGLPGDDFEGFARSVDEIVQLDPENVTIHTFCVKKSAEILKIDTEIYNRSAEETVKGVDYSQIALKNAGYVPYYIYRQKNTVGNLENVGFAKRGTEGLYNVLMMEELHTIFAVGAGAVTKLVDFPDGSKPALSAKRRIKRVFEPKYPYEYLATNLYETTEKKFKTFDRFLYSHEDE